MNDKTLKVVRVVAVSPGDVPEERLAIGRAVEEINQGVADLLGCHLDLWRWEIDSTPTLHRDGQQGDIDEKMDIEDADLVIAMFWRRFGTPTGDSESGTQHELRRAWASWREREKPDVALYFCERPATPRTPEEMDQWKRVLEFKESLPPEQGRWEYEQPEHFERLVRQKLTEFLSLKHGRDVTRVWGPTRTGVLDVPRFANAVQRTALLGQVEDIARRNPLVLVEGLSGSGKTWLLATHVARAGMTGSAAWFDPHEGATLDDLIIALSDRFEFRGLSGTAKAKELVNQLEARSLLLVIDDFQRVDHASMAPLLALAAQATPPARLVLASRSFIDVPGSSTASARLRVDGLREREVEELLRTRGVRHLSSGELSELTDKVDGLPIAIDVFSSLVADFGRRPGDLLAGSMLVNERIRAWFDELLVALPDDAQKLLSFLSVATVPFNIGLVRMAGRRLGAVEPEETLEDLQRAYLVQAYSPYRWTVHHLIGALATATQLDDQELRDIHAAYASYYRVGPSTGPRPIVDDETFMRQVAACRHLQASRQYEEAERMLGMLAPTAKAAGHYDAFMQLCRAEIDAAPVVDPWMRYHLAHCALITGRVDEARAVTVALRHLAGLTPDLQLSAARLHAEILQGDGEVDEALEVVRGALSEVGSDVQDKLWAQTRMEEARVLLRAGRLGESLEVGLELLAHTNQAGDKRGSAVALSHLGHVSLAEADYDVAVPRLRGAAELFMEVRDRRGEGWALTGLAEAELGRDHPEAGLVALDRGLRIRAEIGEASAEYLEQLHRIRGVLPGSADRALLDAESERVSVVLGNGLVGSATVGKR